MPSTGNVDTASFPQLALPLYPLSYFDCDTVEPDDRDSSGSTGAQSRLGPNGFQVREDGQNGGGVPHFQGLDEQPEHFLDHELSFPVYLQL